MTFSRYIILHIDLSADVQPVQNAGDAGHYCVFWYRSLPLGELYLDLHEPVSGSTFWQRCVNAISPALRAYALRKGTEISRMPSPDPGSIRGVCAGLLDDQHPGNCREVCDVSVVICTRNRALQLRTCLTHLDHQRCKPAEIIVVDNASDTDDTREVAMEFGVRYIREDIPGLDVARNTGARAARSAIVAYTDDDTLPDSYWVHRVAETFDNPDIAAMTGLVIAASLETEAEVIFEKFWPFNRGYVKRIYGEEFLCASLENGPAVWEIGAGANMAFRKSVFERTGYFDERLDVGAAGCSGDSEMWYRILACGFDIEYNPLAVVHHKHRNSIPELRKQLYCYMRGFTVAILIQFQRFGHRGNLQRLFRVLPSYYVSLLRKGFPRYDFQYSTVFAELTGVMSGLIYYVRHRKTDPKIFSHENY